MGRQVVKQPDGNFAIWSSVVDDFILGDATRLDDFPEIPKKVHVVIFRHPKITEDKKTGGI